MIEKTVIRHLMEALETEHVYAERPTAPPLDALPEEYYLIEKVGGGERNHILNATIAVQSISAVSMLRAAEMSEAAEKAMRDLPAKVDDVSRSRLNAAYNFTDTETKEYRYQAVFDLIYMEGE
jgi:hypothetical protein